MSTLSDMPWKTHAVLALACPVVMVTPAYRVYGFGPADWPTGEVMSFGILLFAWLVVAGMIWLEVAAVAGHRLSEARCVAFVAHIWLAGVASMPVWFAFFWTELSPIDLAFVRMAANTYLVLLVGYLVGILAVVVREQQSSSRLDPQSLRIDEGTE